MLTVENTVLIVIDMQEKLAKAMHDRENLAKRAAQMVNGAKVLGIPVIWTEQNPNGLGSTLPEIRERLVDSHPVVKFSFSCCGEPKFMEVVKDCGRKQVLVLGIECHVCVCQTIIDLKELGYEYMLFPTPFRPGPRKTGPLVWRGQNRQEPPLQA